MTRAPVDDIQAPPFPVRAHWLNTPRARARDLAGHPMLVEFWDFCRPNSLRTLPYLMAWHVRYGDAGLRMVGVHSPGFAPSASPGAVADAVARLGIGYPVLVDSELEVWRDYDNLGWPARYLFNGDGMLHDYHFGEGGYAETERAIQELLGVERALLAPQRPEDDPDAALVVQSDDRPGPYSGPYEAGAVWAVLEPDAAATPPERTAIANGTEIVVDHPGAYPLLVHEVSTAGELALEIGAGVTCHAVCFTPGVAS